MSYFIRLTMKIEVFFRQKNKYLFAIYTKEKPLQNFALLQFFSEYWIDYIKLVYYLNILFENTLYVIEV